MPPKGRKATSSAARQDGGYKPPILVEPNGGPIPTRPARSRAVLRHMPGKHNQLDHAHGGGHRPDSGSPAATGRATVSRQPGRDPRLSAGGRSVDLSRGERDRLRRLISSAQYSDAGARDDDGVYRLTRGAETLVSLRHVPGTHITDDGRPVDSPDEGGGHEVYDAEFDMVLAEAGEFDDEPSVRVTLEDLDNILEDLDAASREPTAKSVDTGLGQVDVSTPGQGRIALRVPTDDGDVDVEFDKADWKKVWAGINESLDRREPVTVDTANGPVEIQTDNPGPLVMGPEAMLFISGESWSVAAQGEGIKRLYMALLANGRAAGIVRSTGHTKGSNPAGPG